MIGSGSNQFQQSQQHYCHTCMQYYYSNWHQCPALSTGTTALWPVSQKECTKCDKHIEQLLKFSEEIGRLKAELAQERINKPL